MFPEAQAPAHHVLPQPRLRLVQAHRRSRSQRRSVVLLGEALLEQTVAPFMNGAEDGRQRVALVDADGEANVAGVGASREGMDALVLAAGVEVEAHRRQQLQRELPLRRSIEGLA